MRRFFTILFTVLLAVPLTLPSRAQQVVVDVLQPPALQGTLASTWAEPAAGSWNTPDMTMTTNRVVGDLALALDASAADSLCCEAVAVPASIAGKVALLYRGTCDYSVKAKNCQDAGALAVVIINNVPGAPVAWVPAHWASR